MGTVGICQHLSCGEELVELIARANVVQGRCSKKMIIVHKQLPTRTWKQRLQVYVWMAMTFKSGL